MSKSDQNKAKTQAQDQISKTEARGDKAESVITGAMDTAKATSASMLPGITAGYSDIAATGGLSGRLDPSLSGTAAKSFSSLATSGGISPEEAQAMRERASEASSSAYSTASDEAKRASAATGGYGLSGATFSNLARKGSQAAEKATIDTEASIAGTRQAGKVAGASGLTGLATAEEKAAEAQLGGRLAGLGGMSNIYGLSESQQNSLIDQMLANYRQTGQLSAEDLQIFTSLANQPGIFDKIVSTIGTLGGAAGGVMSGIGAMTRPIAAASKGN